MKQELLENKDNTGIDEMFFQKCNEKFNFDLPVQLKNISQVSPTRQESVQTHIEQSPVEGEAVNILMKITAIRQGKWGWSVTGGKIPTNFRK